MAWVVQTRVSIRRATIDFISTHEMGNPEWNKATRLFVRITARDDAAQYLIALLTPKTPEQLEERYLIAFILNYYEGVAVAIKHKAISADIYKDWNGSGYVDTWNQVEPYVTARRQMGNRSTAHSHFEDLAKKWKQEGIEPGSGTDRAPAVQSTGTPATPPG